MKGIVTSMILMLALGAAAAEAAPAPAQQLALHPQCFTTGGHLFVRGAVIDADDRTPIEGARVVLRTRGGETLRGRTDASGIYVATGAVTVATGDAVREVATYLPASTGTLVPAQAPQLGAGMCHVASATIGALQEVTR